MSGTLYICALPIGNLADISERVLETLRQVDYIACEDTRTLALNYKELQLNKPFVSYHDHSSPEKLDKIINDLKQGQSVALVSDAGTPLISDPGYHLVKRCHAEKITVDSLPGPTALITALALSGLPTDRFCFEGFLKPKSAARQQQLKNLIEEKRTMVFYESPHRILKTVAEMLLIFGDTREVFIVRELTKKYQEYLRGPLAEVVPQLNKRKPRGEYVIVLAGA